MTKSNSLGRVYVHGPGRLPVISMFAEMGYRGATTVEDADIVCFTGGEDVDPHLYGETPLSVTYYNPMRDKNDMAIYHQAVDQMKFLVGICRGAQFLNVMNGGKLWQHVDGHSGDHWVKDVKTGQEHRVTSTHHQMMRPTAEAEIVATAREANFKMYGPAANGTYIAGSWNVGTCRPDDDIEAVWYKDTASLCVQFHPEYELLECTEYFEELLWRYYQYEYVCNMQGETRKCAAS